MCILRNGSDHCEKEEEYGTKSLQWFAERKDTVFCPVCMQKTIGSGHWASANKNNCQLIQKEACQKSLEDFSFVLPTGNCSLPTYSSRSPTE
jgi:hypothetical protein